MPDIVRQLVLSPYGGMPHWPSQHRGVRLVQVFGIMNGPSHPGHGVCTRPARCTTGLAFRTESAECMSLDKT